MIHRLVKTTAAYPVAVVYLAASLMLFAAVQNVPYRAAAIFTLGVLATTVVALSMYIETKNLRTEHERLVERCGELMERCEQLSATLTAYGHDVPPPPVHIEEE